MCLDGTGGMSTWHVPAESPVTEWARGLTIPDLLLAFLGLWRSTFMVQIMCHQGVPGVNRFMTHKRWGFGRRQQRTLRPTTKGGVGGAAWTRLWRHQEPFEALFWKAVMLSDCLRSACQLLWRENGNLLG